MTEQQQPEQTDEQAEQSNIVVILTDGTVLNWPANTTAFNALEDGPLYLYAWDPTTEKRGDLIAAIAKGQWASAYDDGHLTS